MEMGRYHLEEQVTKDLCIPKINKIIIVYLDVWIIVMRMSKDFVKIVQVEYVLGALLENIEIIIL